MKKVLIKSITYETPFGDYIEETEVYVDDKFIGSGGYGGDPEDNKQYRTYRWVEPLFRDLALALGAEVEMIDTEEKPEED